MNTDRWSGPIPVEEVVYKAVLELTDVDPTFVFTIKDVKTVISRNYPDFKLRTVESQIISGCANHTSRDHHYRSTSKDRYWRIRRGQYRLYNPKKDKNV